ncbi:2'-5' RNA ligase family protein [Pseudoroseomonas wenyumeiae]|uniref:2'-5' RNA ligase family protein n=1 Tax=Teichococcus wenyumeiae TaxID=2478470 RepID=A0A3A9JEF0_9PROT|nr:2'-5' RNA ligase family protein [Pseudoroseomonas wenyumeiae]RKK01996.1 2'-5' RNA ligase family protein [Pseudoroseomonas wenyumeiae]RMI24754.1 2'-5' RNA ligase family protein [Pseudoroseomonas wenyumeiae]
MDEAPLILTLGLDAASFTRLDALRRAHFPPERNYLSAHLTLFHALPGAMLAEISANLETLAAGTPPPALHFAGLRSLGRGVAFTVESPALVRLRGLLASAWHGLLGAQDRQGFRPHVTVQNKVEPAAARALLAELENDFTSWEGQGVSLLLWHYRGGPWEPAGTFALTGSDKPAGR